MPIEIVMIVVASMIFTLVLINMLARLKKDADGPNIQQEEFEALKERVRVLERITVEEGNSLAAEIAALEDRSGPTLDELSAGKTKTADRA
ncbi:hypothetical protein [Sphingomicrobium clamense]|uniref:Phage shock protein B n=1 Tax=Sphingomicrobium clamense TaxID=2851013 RepID=A0ABS6V6P4_9SPHN|nr:hypothetical protein [Sphingomicrobium sp. B8]MBW0145025.1 hypothetical protein [Sphingomicrobium sp. B8]